MKLIKTGLMIFLLATPMFLMGMNPAEQITQGAANRVIINKDIGKDFFIASVLLASATSLMLCGKNFVECPEAGHFYCYDSPCPYDAITQAFGSCTIVLGAFSIEYRYLENGVGGLKRLYNYLKSNF